MLVKDPVESCRILIIRASSILRNPSVLPISMLNDPFLLYIIAVANDIPLVQGRVTFLKGFLSIHELYKAINGVQKSLRDDTMSVHNAP